MVPHIHQRHRYHCGMKCLIQRAHLSDLHRRQNADLSKSSAFLGVSQQGCLVGHASEHMSAQSWIFRFVGQTKRLDQVPLTAAGAH